MQIEDHLTLIKSKMAIGERQGPERLLIDLLTQMGPAELADWRPDLLRIIGEFQKKRQKNLLNILDAGSQTISNPKVGIDETVERVETFSISPESQFVSDFRDALDELGHYHIFQWSTFYRDCLDDYFGQFLEALARPSLEDPVHALVNPLSDHTEEVFGQGYNFVRRSQSHDDAITKSLSGLSQFLRLPLDYYLSQASSVSEYNSVVALRILFSSALTGIFEGYSRAQFGPQTGSGVLARFQRQWAHYVAFLTPQHAQQVIRCVESGPFTNGLQISVLPLLDALHKFFRLKDDDYWPMPLLGQYSWPQRRLDISIRPPQSAVSQGLLETRAFLEESFVHTEHLDTALGRQVALVIAPVRPDIKKILDDRERLKAIVVPVDQALAVAEVSAEQNRIRTAERAFSVLDAALYARRSKLEAKTPITYNIAREFPLHHPDKASFFHVSRTSVRDLLRTFERQNGVRLWCSVRRSGKTTACFDMETTTGDSVIIGQTCGTPPIPTATIFYENVRKAVSAGVMIPSTFVRDSVTECASVNIEGRRLVLIIDEYETLFGLLKVAAVDTPATRYNVVQPLLDQLVTFSQENLLVLLGQQPDAHFILMEQNQLAPYVTQDSFPLFEHIQGTSTGEFSKLVEKILLGRIEFGATFLDALYEETAGHPFLTANLLIEFVDWLIERRRPQHGLRLQRVDFTRFIRAKMMTKQILMSKEFNFFRQAAASALSEQGYRDNPWLFAAYWVLRGIANEDADKFRVNRKEFENLSQNIPIPPDGMLPDSADILRTASQANFLSYDKNYVNVRIRTLGRITSAVRPALT